MGLTTWKWLMPLIRTILMELFSCSVVSDSLRPHGLQHARLPSPSLSPRSCSNSCPLSRWCHPTILSSVVPFSSCLLYFPASGYFPMSQFFPSGGQTIGASASTSVLPVNTQDWSPLGWTGWINLLAVQGALKSLLQHHSSKASVLQHLLTKTNKNTSTYGTIIMENEIGKRDPIQPKL